MPGVDPYALSPRQLSILARPAIDSIVHAGARVVVRTIDPIDLTNTNEKLRFRAQTEIPIEFARVTYAPKGADVFLKAVCNPLPDAGARVDEAGEWKSGPWGSEFSSRQYSRASDCSVI